MDDDNFVRQVLAFAYAAAQGGTSINVAEVEFCRRWGGDRYYVPARAAPISAMEAGSLFASGLPVREISERMGVDPRTIRRYLARRNRW